MDPSEITSAISGLADAGGPAQDSAQAPAPVPQAQPVPTQASPQSAQPPVPSGPHAGIQNIMQSLVLGMDAFGKSLATQGREGGVGEVVDYQKAKQDMALKQQAAQREQSLAGAQLTHLQALTNASIAQTEINKMNAPAEHQKLVIDNQKSLYDLYTNILHINPLFAVPIVQGQGTDEHMAGINAKASGDLVNNTVIPVHDNSVGGSGNSYGFNFDQLRKVNVPLDQAAPVLNNLQNQIDYARQVLPNGDKDPAIQMAQGKLDVMKKGGSVNGYDFFVFDNLVQSQILQKVAQQQKITDFNKQQAEAVKARNDAAASARPKDLNDAVGRLTQAQQTFKTAPTPQNQLGVTAAQTAVNTFQREDTKAAAQKTFATKSAELNAMDVNDEKNLPALKEAALNYQVDPDKVFSIRGSQRSKFLSAMLQQDPTWSMAKYKAKFDTAQDFTPKGKSGQQVMALNTFAGHAADAMDLVDTLRNTGSPLINAPMNKVAETLGNDKIGPFNAAMMAAKEEYQNFLKGGHAATKEEIERVEQLGSANSTPAQNQAILKQMANTVLIRANSLNSQYKATMGTDYPNMFNTDGAQAMVKLGQPGVSKFGVNGTVGGPAERKVFGQDGKTVIGYTTDGKTMRPAQ